MILAAHQPNFLPWLGFFDRIRQAERFVLLDHVQFERQNFQNRTRILMGDMPMWMTVPVVQNSRDETILEKAIHNELDGKLSWGEKVYKTLEHAYGRAPYFKRYAGRLREIFGSSWRRLVDLNLTLLGFCLEALEIRTPLLRSSALKPSGKKSELVLSLCRRVGADVYLAGMGGSKGYLNVSEFARAGIRVEWQRFTPPQYRPLGSHPAETCLSVVDLLFHCGPESGAVLRGERHGAHRLPVDHAG